MDRKGLVILPSWSDAFRAFTKPRSTGEILAVINEYYTTGKEPVLPEKGEVTVAWTLIKPLMDSHKADVENGAKGGAPKGNQNARKTTEVELEINPITTPLVLENNPPTSEKTTKKEKEKEIYNKPPIVPQRGTVSASFEKFWNAYPKSRRVGKQKAIKALERALKMTDIDTILNAIEKQKHGEAWTKDNGQFIPHPTTWLNQGRWDDEIVVSDNTEPEREYHPITPLTKCKVCGSRNVVTRGMYASCLNGDCGASFVWSSVSGDWKEES